MTHSFGPKARALALAAVLVALAGTGEAQTVAHRNANGVSWLTGGVTDEERNAMRDAASGYNLQVVVAMEGNGAYRADVPVAVEDSHGDPVLMVVTDGPWLFASLPPGRYRVRTGDGQESSVDVSAGGRSVVVFHSRTE